MKQQLKSGDEYDVISKRSRKLLCMSRKIIRKVKRAVNKRFRKEGKQGAKDDRE